MEYDTQKNTTDNFVIVDGHHLLFRMFYGVQTKMRSTHGVLLNAALGFASSIIKYIRLLEPQYFVVVFDSEQATFRSELDNQYKATRNSDFTDVCDDDNPFTQYPIITRLLDSMSIRHCESAYFEADDVMASYARQYESPNKIIISGDSDLLQVVDDMTMVYMDRGLKSIMYDSEAVRLKMGVEPCYVADYKALVGDKTDNVAGVAGIGPQTAVKLIKKYGGVDSIVDNIASVEPRSLKDKLTSNLDIIVKSKQLVTIHQDVSLAYPLADLAVDCGAFAELKAIDCLRNNGYLQ